MPVIFPCKVDVNFTTGFKAVTIISDFAFIFLKDLRTATEISIAHNKNKPGSFIASYTYQIQVKLLLKKSARPTLFENFMLLQYNNYFFGLMHITIPRCNHMNTILSNVDEVNNVFSFNAYL